MYLLKATHNSRSVSPNVDSTRGEATQSGCAWHAGSFCSRCEAMSLKALPQASVTGTGGTLIRKIA